LEYQEPPHHRPAAAFCLHAGYARIATALQANTSHFLQGERLALTSPRYTRSILSILHGEQLALPGLSHPIKLVEQAGQVRTFLAVALVGGLGPPTGGLRCVSSTSPIC